LANRWGGYEEGRPDQDKSNSWARNYKEKGNVPNFTRKPWGRKVGRKGALPKKSLALEKKKKDEKKPFVMRSR